MLNQRLQGRRRRWVLVQPRAPRLVLSFLPTELPTRWGRWPPTQTTDDGSSQLNRTTYGWPTKVLSLEAKLGKGGRETQRGKPRACFRRVLLQTVRWSHLPATGGLVGVRAWNCPATGDAGPWSVGQQALSFLGASWRAVGDLWPFPLEAGWVTALHRRGLGCPFSRKPSWMEMRAVTSLCLRPGEDLVVAKEEPAV